MAKQSGVRFTKPVIQGNSNKEWLEIEYLSGPFSGKIEKVLKERANYLIKQGKAKSYDKEKGSI